MGLNATFTKWFPAGFRLINGQTLNQYFNFPQANTEDKITAFAGGGQANAYGLTAYTSRLTTVANANDSVKLPPTSQWVGGRMVVINDGAQNAAVYPGNATDNIDNAGVNTSVVITAGKRTIFYCTSAGIICSLEGNKTT